MDYIIRALGVGTTCSCAKAEARTGLEFIMTAETHGDQGDEVVLIKEGPDGPCLEQVEGPLVNQRSAVSDKWQPPQAFMKKACVTLPIQVKFVVPMDASPGQELWLNGPHGPFRATLPDGAVPGEEAKVRVGPTRSFSITVPENNGPGDTIRVKIKGVMQQVVVPAGKQAGESFDIVPQAFMVLVPEKVQPGECVTFDGQDGKERVAVVPRGKLVGEYFEVSFTEEEVPQPNSENDENKPLNRIPKAEASEERAVSPKAEASEERAVSLL